MNVAPVKLAQNAVAPVEPSRIIARRQLSPSQIIGVAVVLGIDGLQAASS